MFHQETVSSEWVGVKAAAGLIAVKLGPTVVAPSPATVSAIPNVTTEQEGGGSSGAESSASSPPQQQLLKPEVEEFMKVREPREILSLEFRANTSSNYAYSCRIRDQRSQVWTELDNGSWCSRREIL